MEYSQEQKLLQQYAAIANSKVLSSQADLNPKDRALPEMISWCRRHATIVVLLDGTILCSNPASRIVQNCKIVMQNKGLIPGAVYPATTSLITILLENAADPHAASTENPIVVSTQQQRLRMLVKEALNAEASDIHIEVRSDIARIRFRSHGELYLHAEWIPKLAREVISVAFNKETDHAVTHFNSLTPQNASMPLVIDHREVRLRLTSLPAHQGFDVVMRLLTVSDENILSLEKLGYNSEQIQYLQRAVRMPSGAVIMAGPTGSGKTTTLASCMQLAGAERKVYTIEDPVEKYIPGVTQIPVNTEHDDRSFAAMARTVLRMDPDVVVLGEMRDEETAQVMMRAAITGHLVFSTLHSNSAQGIITRLIDLGISTSLLATPNLLACLICQRLAPLLCDMCAIPVTQSIPHQAFLTRWRKNFGEHLARMKGRSQHACRHCNGIGISGRTAVAEIIWLDEPGREYIQQSNLLGWNQHLKMQGWKSYPERIMQLVLAGRCDPLDAERMIGELSTAPSDFA
jgi:type II secretory ATPase GspE/PulE/Tfp pilus assembly ATPase PilB-like protein